MVMMAYNKFRISVGLYGCGLVSGSNPSRRDLLELSVEGIWLQKVPAGGHGTASCDVQRNGILAYLLR